MQLEYTEKKDLLGIDFNKAYTSNLYDMRYISIFNVFDEFIMMAIKLKMKHII